LTAQGHPRAIFRRAIERGNVVVAAAAARGLGQITLGDALALTALVAQKDPGRRSRIGVIIPAPGVCCRWGIQKSVARADGGLDGSLAWLHGEGRTSVDEFDLLRDLTPPTSEIGPARRHSFAALAVAAGIVTADQFSEALEEGQRTGERPGEVLVRRGWAGEEEIARVLAQQWELPFATGVSPSQDPAVREVLPVEEARRLEVYPLSYEEGDLIVALADPSDERLRALHARLGDAIRPVIVPRSELQALLESARAPESADVFESPQSPVDSTAQIGDEVPDTISDDHHPLMDEFAELTVALDSSGEQLNRVRANLDGLAEALVRARGKLERCEQQVQLLEAERAQGRAAIREVLDKLRSLKSILP
jgi:MshEN domain